MQRPLLMERRRVFSAFGSTVRLSTFLWIRWCRWRVLHQQGHFLALWIKLPDLPREGEEGNGVFLLWSWVSVLSWRPLWSQWRFSWSHMLCMPVLVAFCCVLLIENEYSMRLEHQIHRITVSLTTTGLRIVVLGPRVSAFQPVLLKSRSGS